MKMRGFFAAAILMLNFGFLYFAGDAGGAVARAVFADMPYFCEEVTAENAYAICLSEKDFADSIISAEIYRPEFSAGGEEIWLICARAGTERRLCESYESPPCDPAEAAAFAFSGENILFAKGDAKSVRTAIAAFEEIYGIRAIEYIKDTV